MYVRASWRKFGEMEGQDWKNLREREGQFKDFMISEASEVVIETDRERRKEAS